MYLVLASQSPRRKEILENAGYEFIVKPANIDESNNIASPYIKALAVAKKKGMQVYNNLADADAVVLSADTIVQEKKQILGKPKTKDEAMAMIKLLQGRTHHVYTGVFIKSIKEELSFWVKTAVKIKKMTDAEIEEYCDTNEPYDKAGAYAIQGIFYKYIDSICGDFLNVMGLPLYKVNKVLAKYNLPATNLIQCEKCKNNISPGNTFCPYCKKDELKGTNKLSLSSMILGIISITLSVVFFPYMIYAVPGFISIVLGLQSLSLSPEKKTKATTGIVLGIASNLLAYVSLFIALAK